MTRRQGAKDRRGRASSAAVALAIATAVVLVACGQNGPTATILDADASPSVQAAPTPTQPRPGLSVTPSPGPGSALGPGLTRLVVSGVLFEPCVPPPSGCGYDLTLRDAAGTQFSVTLNYPADYHAQSEGLRTPMTAEPGLPSTLAPGDYTAVFRSLEWSDYASPVLLPSGGLGYLPVVQEGCRRTFSVKPATTSIRLEVTWRGFTCRVKVTKR